MVDNYTLMSLCDVIYQLCSIFKESSQDLALQVLPNLIECLDITKEDHANSIFSLIGTFFIRVI